MAHLHFLFDVVGSVCMAVVVGVVVGHIIHRSGGNDGEGE